MNMWHLVCVLGIAFGQDFQDLLDEVNDCIYVDVFLEPFCRLNLTTSCWVLLLGLFPLTSQAGSWGLVLAQLWICKTFVPFHSRGNLGRRMAEESTPIQDSDRSVRGFFFLPFLLSYCCHLLQVCSQRRWSLNGDGLGCQNPWGSTTGRRAD